MLTSIRIIAATALLAAASAAATVPAVAAPIGQPLAIAKPTSDLTEQVYWRGRGWGGRGWHGGGAFVGGLAAGALIGGALAAPYGYPYYYGPGYYGPGYPPPPAYYAPPPGDAVAYCMQRFRSYDPNSGTYLGNDGRRHPCP